MKTKLGIAFITSLTLLYVFYGFQRAYWLLKGPGLVSKGLGISLIVIPAMVMWAVFAEFRFGFQTKKLADELEKNNELPEDDLPRTPGGRIIKSAADERFQEFKQDVEQNPQSWKAWFNVSCGYDMAGDRTRARSAMRKAIELYRTSADLS
ncbi:MAG: hypothetical protein QM632_00255 [Micrococcaceae bacterium]